MITPPWFTDSVETIAFNAYVMHTNELDKLIQYFREHPELSLDSDNDVSEACMCLGLSISHLASDEYEYVRKGLIRLW